MRIRFVSLLMLGVLFSTGFISTKAVVAQDVDTSGPWAYVGVTRTPLTCPAPGVQDRGVGTFSGNSVRYQFTFPEAPNDPWVFDFSWEDVRYLTPFIVAQASGTIVRRGLFAVTARLLMYVESPGFYGRHDARIEFGPDQNTVSDYFEAYATPELNQPFDVVVWFSAQDLCQGELARYHFRRLTDGEAVPATPVPPPPPSQQPAAGTNITMTDAERAEICALVESLLLDLTAKEARIIVMLDKLTDVSGARSTMELLELLESDNMVPSDLIRLLELDKSGYTQGQYTLMQAALVENREAQTLVRNIGAGAGCPPP